MNRYLVSVIVPIYGVESYIKDCIISLVNQTYSNIELIFVNDKTKDKSIDILKEVLSKYNTDYMLIEHAENLGLAAARNSGIRNANGDFIINVDSDDSLAPTAIELLLEKALSEKSDIVLSDWLILNDQGTTYKKIKYSIDNVEYFNKVLMRSASFSIAGKLFHKRLFDNVSFVEGINFGEDYLTFTKLLFYAKKISFVKKPLYIYNKKNTNSYTNLIGIESIKQLCDAQINLMEFCKSNGVNIKLIQNSTTQCIVHLIKTSNGKRSSLEYIYNSLYHCDYICDKLSIQDKVIYKLFAHRLFSVIQSLFYLTKHIKI